MREKNSLLRYYGGDSPEMTADSDNPMYGAQVRVLTGFPTPVYRDSI